MIGWKEREMTEYSYIVKIEILDCLNCWTWDIQKIEKWRVTPGSCPKQLETNIYWYKTHEKKQIAGSGDKNTSNSHCLIVFMPKSWIWFPIESWHAEKKATDWGWRHVVGDKWGGASQEESSSRRKPEDGCPRTKQSSWDNCANSAAFIKR